LDLSNRFGEFTILLMLFVLLDSTPLIAAGDLVGFGSSDSNGALALASQESENAPLYPIVLTFVPSVIAIPRGGYGYVTLYVYNGGASAFTVTACKVKIRWSTGVKEKGYCGIATFVIYPGQTVPVAWTWEVGAGAPVGASLWTLILKGYVGATKMKSNKGLQTVIVT